MHCTHTFAMAASIRFFLLPQSEQRQKNNSVDSHVLGHCRSQLQLICHRQKCVYIFFFVLLFPPCAVIAIFSKNSKFIYIFLFYSCLCCVRSCDSYGTPVAGDSEQVQQMNEIWHVPPSVTGPPIIVAVVPMMC